MRIAQVVTLFLPDFVGGATLVCERITRRLLARGHRAEVFCGRPHPQATPYGESEWSVGGITVTGVNVAPGYAALDRRSYHHPEVEPVFERFLDRVQPEVVHFHSIQALGANLLEVAARRGLPIVLTMHDWWWFCARLFLVDLEGFVCPPCVEPARCHCAPGFDLTARRRYLATALAHAGRILTPSYTLADAAVANGVPGAAVEVCPNGLDRPPTRVGRRPGPVRFGYFGGPDNRLKGLPTLLAAADALGIGGWELLLYGVGARTGPIPLAISDRVRRLPAFAPESLSSVLAGIDCLLLPSLMRESYSLATREALAAGIPVIASDSGGPSEIVTDGTNGLIFATGDARDLALQMRRVVLEPALRERLCAGAAMTAVPTVASQVEQLERVYSTVMTDLRYVSRLGATGAGDTLALGQPQCPAVTPRHGTLAAEPPPRSQHAPHAPRRVLFVTGIDGAPLRYRVTNLGDQLRLHGIASHLLYFTDQAVPAAIAEADLVVVYRVPAGDYVSAWIACARRLGRPLVFSCDDLVFDPAATPDATLSLLPGGHRAGWLAYTERYAQTLAACDAFIGTTEPLVASAARAGVPGFVVRNGLGAFQLAVAEGVYKNRWRSRLRGDGEKRADGRVHLAYLSGTITHDLDFATIESALAAVLSATPNACLRLIGYLRTGPALAPFADRIERLPFLPWRDLLARLAEADVNLAPLRAEPFSDAKSEVKYLEAAALGVPTVATPTAAFRHAIRDGANGLLASTTAEWRDALERLLGDAGLRNRLGNAARDDVFLHYTPVAQAPVLMAALSGVCTRSDMRSKAPAPPAPQAMEREPPSALVARYPGQVGRYDVEPDDALPGAAQPARDTPSPFLLPGRCVGQTFCSSAGGLYRIDLCVGTEGRRHGHRLVIHLTDSAGGNGPDLRVATIDCMALTDNGWIAVEFEPLVDSAGCTFYVWIESEGAREGDAVVLWTYVDGWGEPVPGGLHVDHHPVSGSLTFRTFHRRLGAHPHDPHTG